MPTEYSQAEIDAANAKLDEARKAEAEKAAQAAYERVMAGPASPSAIVAATPGAKTLQPNPVPVPIPPTPENNAKMVAMQKMALDLGALEIALNKYGLSVVQLLRNVANDKHGVKV